MILYLETNFVVGAGTGQDAYADQLLRVSLERLRLILPAICVMESLSVLEGKRTMSNRFALEMEAQITQLSRDVTSEHAQVMQMHLEQALVASDNVFNAVERRLQDTLAKLAGAVPGYRPAEILSLPPNAVVQALNTPLMGEPTDNLILAVIEEHARQNTGEEKVMLSGNTKDFGAPTVRARFIALQIRYFAKTQDFLGWFNSRP